MALHQLLRIHARFAMVHAITRSRMSRVSAAAPIVMFIQPNMMEQGYTKLQTVDGDSLHATSVAGNTKSMLTSWS